MISLERSVFCYGAAITTGLIAWLGVLLALGIEQGDLARALRREAWDTGPYWLIALPLCYLMAGVLGYLGPEGIWRWPTTIMATQLFCLVLFSPSDLSLLPLGVILMVILGLPGLAAAGIGRLIRRL